MRGRHAVRRRGAALHECPVAPPPVAFAGGCDEFVRAAQEQLGPRLRPSTTTRGIEPEGAGFRVEVADETAEPVRADAVTLATPIDQTATLLAGFDPALFDLVERLERTPRAFVFFGAAAVDCAALQGYGIVPTETVDSPLVEAIHCSRVFPNRCPSGGFLIRCELAGLAPDTDDAAVGSTALDELAAWTDWRAEPTFTHVHRFTTIDRDAAWVETRTRIRALAARLDGLTIV
ncbi:MAG: FAD-dependent oxidoreductase [bacterium]|nr:FAD-dependent oxidoreductase [bacterium]